MNDRPMPAPSVIHPHLGLVPRPSDHSPAQPDEAEVTRLARAARAGDLPARHTLYSTLQPGIDRMVAGCARLARAADCPRRNGQPWDREDLAQEAFLIFCDLVRAWSGDGPFTPYLYGYFPWRLRNAWRRLRPERPRGQTLLRPRLDLAADPSALAEEAMVLLETLAAALPELERAILLAHIRDGLTLSEIANRLGLRPRQIRRRWHEIKCRLRGETDPPRRSGRIIPFPTRSERRDQ